MTTKQPARGTGFAHPCMMANKELVSRLRNAVAHLPKSEADVEHASRQRVGDWLSLLAPPGLPEEKPLSKDISLIGNVVNWIAEAAGENVITEDEADAVTQFIIAKFVERRLESTLRDLFVQSKHHWYFAASKYFDE